MTLEINYLTLVFAVIPVFVFLMLLIFKWGAAEAAPVAALLTIFISFSIFRVSALMIAIEGSKGIWNTMPVMLLFWTAALLYRIVMQFQKDPGKAGSGAAGTGSDNYRRSDVYRQIREAAKEEIQPVSLKEGRIVYLIMLVLAGLMMLLFPGETKAGPFALGFDYPECATGYGFVKQAIQGYSPLQGVLNAGILLLIADVIGMAALGFTGRLKYGAAGSILRKSVEMALPGGISVCGLMLMLALMNGSGQSYVLTMGSAAEISVRAAAVCMIAAAPPLYYRKDQKRAKEAAEEAEKLEQLKKAGKVRNLRKPKFYETRNGGLSIAFLVILAAFILMMVGIWGSDQTLTLDGFAAIVTAMLYCPMRTFIFEKAEKLV